MTPRIPFPKLAQREIGDSIQITNTKNNKFKVKN